MSSGRAWPEGTPRRYFAAPSGSRAPSTYRVTRTALHRGQAAADGGGELVQGGGGQVAQAALLYGIESSVRGGRDFF
jgi:hypothetical protein